MKQHDDHEIWRPVVGYEDAYSVSSLGRIKRTVYSSGSPAGRILKPWVDSRGYLQIGLYVRGRRDRPRVHRLVMRAFTGPCPNGKETNHIDGNKTNNSLINLEYVSHAENMSHAIRTGLRIRVSRAAGYHRDKLNPWCVRIIRRCYALGGFSYVDLAQIWDVTWPTIGFAVRRETWRNVA